MPLPTAQEIGLQTSANPSYQRSYQHSSANSSTVASATKFSSASNSSSVNTSIMSNSKPASTSFKKRSHQWLNDWITDWWGIELISWAISASALFAIFILLQSHRGRPLPEWPFSITVNSLVSIFATIAQMAMMKPVVECISQLKWLWFTRISRPLADFQSFDDASRGPTGSLAFLGKLRGIHLASLGAAITIVAIAFGPVSQQVVTYPLRLHPVGNASVPQVYFFSNLPSATNSDISASLYAALSNGIDAIGVGTNLSTVVPYCNTGNCTWETYSSLGICTSTIDISSILLNNSQSCNTTALDENFESIGGPNPGYPCYNYSLPVAANNQVSLGGNNSNTVSTEAVFGNATIGDGQIMPLIDGDVALPMLSVSSGVYNDHSLVDINILYQPGLQINSILQPPVALQSSLQFCVQTYNTTVSNSNSTTEMVSSQILNITSFNNPSGNSSFSNGTFSVNDTDFTISFNAFVNYQNALLISLPDLCTLIVGLENGTSTEAQSEVAGDTYCFGEVAEAFFQYLQNATDPTLEVSALMQNVAISITNSFREGAGGNTYVNDFKGTALLPVSFVEADYIWFTLPLTLNLLTLVFLLATITKSHRLGAKNWKSSNFTTLQGLHPDILRSLGGLESPSVMEENAEKVVVRLLDAKADERRNGPGWRLVETN